MEACGRPKVAAVIAQTLGLKPVHPQRGWDAPKKLGWSIQRPRPRHARAATEEECAAFTDPSPSAIIASSGST